ncbi:MAG: Xaa-Pro dipeptidase [Gammaproteobacteria bacterium]|jgi:Xaa-Pro dipeptidase|nr:Xaa-Pro dipeptidase [Chromatiales bacterium]MDP6674281.1 Xaa-Pro dipeptidase [Gammaproteobacteria bacterium]
MATTAANQFLAALYPAHLDIVKARYDEALAATGYDAIAIGAGAEIFFFLDDQGYPFKPNPHILQWLPLLQHPESVLHYRPGEKPRLLVHQPDDYWFALPALPGETWAQHFDIMALPLLSDIDQVLNKSQDSVAYLGDTSQWRHDPPVADRNPDKLLTHLHYYRPFRTGYEVECIRQATALAVPAHRAAEQAFRAGAAEYDILLAFLAASRCTENELPYPAIIAKNTHGAVLHYQHYEREPGDSNSLLIDAGCSCNGYASDITRTYSYGPGDFQDLIDGLDDIQRQLVSQIAPDISFVDLHASAHEAIGSLLQATGIVSTAITDPVEAGITAAFFPHGLGHYLGLQVHEVGSSYADTAGTETERSARYPKLRLNRTLETGQVLTIEPGLYFIDSLLDELRTQPAGKAINWEKVAHLKKFGGIRIEDNVLVTDDGQENLTRPVFEL